MAAIAAHDIPIPQRILDFLRDAPEDAPDPDTPFFARNDVRVIASAARSLEAAAALAEERGLPAVDPVGRDGG